LKFYYYYLLLYSALLLLEPTWETGKVKLARVCIWLVVCVHAHAVL